MCNCTVRVLGSLSLLLTLCGSGVQAESGGLGEVGELSEFQKTTPRGSAEESTEQTAKQTIPDIWLEVRMLRDMEHSESQVDDLKAELLVTKLHLQLLQEENSVQATKLITLETRLAATESETSDLEKENAALSCAGNVGPYNTDLILKYCKVFTNIGNAYNPATDESKLLPCLVSPR